MPKAESPKPAARSAKAAPAVGSTTVLDVIRRSRVATLGTVAGIALLLAMLMSLLIDSSADSAVIIALLVLFAALVGVATRLVAADAEVPTLLTAAGVAGVGTPLFLSLAVSTGDNGLPFGDALVNSLGADYFTAGAALAAVIATVVVGWGKR